MNKRERVDLGVLEKGPKWKFSSHLFPSKVGGRPAWLSLKPIPTADELKCQVCNDVCTFLLQIYSPVEESTNSFHRTLFVFICRNPSCCLPNDNRNIIVLRSCLPRKNTFFSYDPPDYDFYSPNEKQPSAEDYQDLCRLCGCRGDKKCSACKKVSYCSKSHQVLDWKEGHKEECNKVEHGKNDRMSKHLFEEYLLDISGESDNESSEEEEEDAQSNINNCEATNLNENSPENNLKNKYSVEELEKMAFSKTDKAFDTFKKVVKNCPEQVIRYSRGGDPLWITNENKLNTNEIPNCQRCGSPRVFESQIMPHLVYKLGLDSTEKSLDWGVIMIFTCQNSCTDDTNTNNYLKEFCYKQDVTDRK